MNLAEWANALESAKVIVVLVDGSVLTGTLEGATVSFVFLRMESGGTAAINWSAIRYVRPL